MKLGTYVEVRAAVADIAAALSNYEKLGLKKVGANVVTDGGLNIGLQTGALPGPTLAYYGSDLDAIKAAGITMNDNVIIDPNGVRLALSANAAPAPMPEGDIMSRKPISRLGKFGEYAIQTTDFEKSAVFWQTLGFDKLHAANEPHPWGIFSDGLTVVGLHQNEPDSGEPMFDDPHITYFAGDMADRIAALKQDGISLNDIPPEQDGKIVNASWVGPGNLHYFLFAGEI